MFAYKYKFSVHLPVLMLSLLVFVAFSASDCYGYYDTGNELEREVNKHEYLNSLSTPITPKAPSDPYTSSVQDPAYLSLLAQMAGARARNSYKSPRQNNVQMPPKVATRPTKKQLHERYLKMSLDGVNEQNRLCWAPPTMEEYIRTFFTFKVADSALSRLCEVQFITNHKVVHFKNFISHLTRIDDAAHGKDATAQITAYAKELEAKAPRIMQEREAWHRKTLNDITINYQNGVKYCSARGWHYDYQTFKNALDEIYAHAKTEGQEETLIQCIMPTIGAFHLNLIDLGIKSDINKLLANYTRWLHNYKGRIPCSFT